MQKIYIDELKSSGKATKSPRKDVLNNILAFSKSLEVVKSKNTKVELNLN
ncbi:MAG: hypothetical protein R2780_12565 [Crocinitomicaceae bacterium]